ncbi:MAG: RagB/SusD family nutrient uptake outer membrane protein [Chitinophagaceae bacterium]|nr:MAG: RagB/SusD family nutrient uptake outer membrane protein [Chitinophagaceae bacterium]
MKYLSIVLAMLVLGSCTKLEPKIYSDLTTSNAYSTESDIDAALNGVYADLDPVPGDSYFYYSGYLVMITDYATGEGFSTAAGDPTQMSNFSYDANNQYLTINWQNMYSLIANANLLISNIKDVKMSDSTKTLIVAQARFLRALAYRDLTDAWGPVPMLTTLQDPTTTYDMSLAPVSEVDSLIKADCQFAIANLPATWTSATWKTRATKGAALMLLGKLYMREHDYTNAKTYIDQLLLMRDEGVYTLNPDFKNVWSGSNPMDEGTIFCIMHEPAQNGAEIANEFGPTDNRVVTNRWQYYGVSLWFWRQYDTADPRRSFFYYNYEGAAPRDGSTSNGFYYMIPNPGETVPPSDTVKFLQNLAPKKYTYQMINDSYFDGRTIIVMRLSDVILCKAEIENALNGPAAALPYLNEIRARAGAPQYGQDPRFSLPTTQAEMADKILAERGFELDFEYKHRPDLIRFGKYVETCNDYLASRGLSQIVTKDMLYFPYPLVDANLNKAMAAANLLRLPK